MVLDLPEENSLTESGELSLSEEMALAVWENMDNNPILKGLSKPTFAYINHFLRELPEMQGLTTFELREHLTNQLVLSYVRDRLLVYVDGQKIEEVPTKTLRILRDFIKMQESTLPDLFVGTASGKKMADTGEKIKKVIETRTIEFESDDEEKGEVIDVELESD